jgi:hypothetical protein
LDFQLSQIALPLAAPSPMEAAPPAAPSPPQATKPSPKLRVQGTAKPKTRGAAPPPLRAVAAAPPPAAAAKAKGRVVVTAQSRWKKAGVKVSAVNASQKIALLLSARDATAREAAYRALESTADKGLAAQCVPDVVGVLGSPASEVCAEEFRRACLVLSHMLRLDPTAIGGLYLKDELWRVAQTTPGNALGVLLSQEGLDEDLSTADVLCAAAELSCYAAVCVRGWADPAAAAGTTASAWLGAWAQRCVYLNNAPGDSSSSAARTRNIRRLCELAIETLRSDETRAQLSEPLVAGLWALVGLCSMLRLELGRMAIEGGGLELASSELKELLSSGYSGGTAAAADLALSVVACPHNCLGMVSMAVFAMVRAAPPAALTDGLLEVLLGTLSAHAIAAGQADTNVPAVYFSLLALQFCLQSQARGFGGHIRSAEAPSESTPTRLMLRSTAPWLQRLLDNELTWSDVQTTIFPGMCAAAKIFGMDDDEEEEEMAAHDGTENKDEDTASVALRFDQQHIDEFVEGSLRMFESLRLQDGSGSGSSSSTTTTLASLTLEAPPPSVWAEGMHNLCMSETHRALLARSPRLTELLTAGLELPLPPVLKQSCVASIAQLALFGSSRETLLLQSDALLVKPLAALLEREDASEASEVGAEEEDEVGRKLLKEHAMVALIALRDTQQDQKSPPHGSPAANGAARTGAETGVGDQPTNGHVLLSYHSGCQTSRAAMQRLNESLKRKGWRTWFDVEHEAATTITASEGSSSSSANASGRDSSVAETLLGAVDGSAVVIVAMTDDYKESSQCALAVSLAQRRGIEIIWLNLQGPDFKPTGWLAAALPGAQEDCCHRFDDIEADDEVAFDARVDPLCMALGGRGRQPQPQPQPQQQPQPLADFSLVPEAVPPSSPAPVPVTNSADQEQGQGQDHGQAAAVDSPSPLPIFSPSVQATPTPRRTPIALIQQQQEAGGGSDVRLGELQRVLPLPTAATAGGGGGGGEISELYAYIERREMAMDRRLQEQRDEFRAERQELESKISDMEKRLAYGRAMSPTFTKEEAITDEQLEKFQRRISVLCAAEPSPLLNEEERFAVEDLCGDFVELQAATGMVTTEMLAVTCGTRQWHTYAAVGKLHAIVMLSEKIKEDVMFARQLRRKLVVV